MARHERNPPCRRRGVLLAGGCLLLLACTLALGTAAALPETDGADDRVAKTCRIGLCQTCHATPFDFPPRPYDCRYLPDRPS